MGWLVSAASGISLAPGSFVRTCGPHWDEILATGMSLTSSNTRRNHVYRACPRVLVVH